MHTARTRAHIGARARARVDGTPARGDSRPPRRAGHATGRGRPADASVPSDSATSDQAHDRELLALQIMRARHRAT